MAGEMLEFVLGVPGAHLGQMEPDQAREFRGIHADGVLMSRPQATGPTIS
jgi:hypothetical protein